jgi:hypothetical protein
VSLVDKDPFATVYSSVILPFLFVTGKDNAYRVVAVKN